MDSLSAPHRWHYLFNSHNQFSFLLFSLPCLADVKMWDMFVVGNWRKGGEYLFNLSILLALTSLMFVCESNLNHMKLSAFTFLFIIYKTYILQTWFIEDWMKQTKNNGQQCTNKWANWHTFLQVWNTYFEINDCLEQTVKFHFQFHASQERLNSKIFVQI